MPLTTNIFKKYPNKIFIETGSHMGDGIQLAIEAGFETIISIELSDKYFQIASNRFKQNENVLVLLGDSIEVLPKILDSLNTSATFWLDGHYSCGDTALGKYWAPLMQELELIKNNHIKTHTIIIDDMRCWKDENPVHGFCSVDIFNKLKEINNEYKYCFEDSVQQDDILVAHL